MNLQVGRALRSAPPLRSTSPFFEHDRVSSSQHVFAGGRRSARPTRWAGLRDRAPLALGRIRKRLQPPLVAAEFSKGMSLQRAVRPGRRGFMSREQI